MSPPEAIRSVRLSPPGVTAKTETSSLPTLVTRSHRLSSLRMTDPWDPRRGMPVPLPPVAKVPRRLSFPFGGRR